ncbi:MAG: M48 family metalloprotease [archaeon]
MNRRGLNQFKTAILLAALTGVLLLVGGLVAGKAGLVIAIIFSIVINFLMFFFSDKIALALYKAKEVKQAQATRLFKIVKETAREAGIPVPRVYIISDQSPNAFATGRSPSKAAIACTEGILSLLNDQELKGVIAHELSHVKNRDTLIATIAATIAGVISFVASMARWAAIFGSDDDRGNWIGLLVIAILAPLIALLLQLAISRSREYLADYTAAHIVHDGKGLAQALEKLEKGIQEKPLRSNSRAGASLFIANPFNAKGLLNMFSTHPPIKERVRRLHAMKF